jgi:hypothetical protein
MRAKWQKLGKRSWDEIRDSWLQVSSYSVLIDGRPDPGLEALASLKALTIKEIAVTYPDVAGLRLNALWEGIYLFKKCVRTKAAAQTLAFQGLHSWSLFNAYHSAYLGARGIMNMLGFVTPKVNGIQVGLDLFPASAPGGSQGKRSARLLQNQFTAFSLAKLDQRYIWEALQRVINMSDVPCWTQTLAQELFDLDYEKISPPRNHFLYKANYWPLEDIILDLPVQDLDGLIGTDLDVESSGFLLRLCFTVHLLFEQLILDLASKSNTILQQATMCRNNLGCDVMTPYPHFRHQVEIARELTERYLAS